MNMNIYLQDTRVFAIAHVIARYSSPQGMTVTDIASMMPCSRTTVQNCLNRHGQIVGVTWQDVPYGTKRKVRKYGFVSDEKCDKALLQYGTYYDVHVRGTRL